jgi:hypothetical protein
MSKRSIKAIEHSDYGVSYIRRFSGKQFEELKKIEKDFTGLDNTYWIAANSLVDQDGNMIYGDDYRDKLADEDLAFLKWVQDEVMLHNNINVGTTIKNSEPIQSVSLPTG